MRYLILFLLVVSLVASCRAVRAADSSELQQIKREIQKIKADEERQRHLDVKLIGELEQKAENLATQNHQLQQSSEKLQTQTSQQLEQLHEQINNRSPAQFTRQFQDYLGTHQFTLTGGVGGDFSCDRQTASQQPLTWARPETLPVPDELSCQS